MSTDKEQYDNKIRNLVPISNLSDSSQNLVIEKSKILSFAADTHIFKQGDIDEFTFYLLDGQLEMQAREEASFKVTTTEDRSQYPLAQVQPRKYTAITLSPVKVLQINRNILEGIVAKDKELKNTGGVTVDDTDDEESLDWMSLVLQSTLFSKIPAANIQQLFVMLQPVNKKAGDVVIKQGDPGDYYYIIQEGRCEVTRQATPQSDSVKLAELSTGASFGEESLLSNKPRNATVTMLTDGILMQLSKENFIELIKKPTLDLISFNDAKKIIEQGGKWLDIRSIKEFNLSHIKDSINLPIFDIRRESDRLQLNQQYIVYSNTRNRGAAAAFLLTELGFSVRYLEKGLSSIPEDLKNEMLVINESPDVVPNIQTEETNNADVNEKDEDLAKLDKFDNTVEQEIIVTHREQRKKLQDRIANIIKAETEKSRPDDQKQSGEILEESVEEIKEDIAQNEKQQELNKDIEEEKRALNELHERNLKEKEELLKLRQEAEELINKERKSLEFSHAQQQAKLAEQKKSIEEETRKIQDTLKEIQAAKLEAEAVRKAAEEEAVRLREQQTLTEEELTRTSLNILTADIQSAESKLTQAQQKLIYANQAEETVKSAIEMNEQDILRHKEEEEKIQRQLEEEMAAWSREQAEHDNILKQAESHSEHIRKIREKTEIEKQKAEKATQELFDDISKELKND